MMHGYDTYIWSYNTWLGRGKPQKMQNYFDAEAEEEAGFCGFCPAWETGFLFASSGRGWMTEVATS